MASKQRTSVFGFTCEQTVNSTSEVSVARERPSANPLIIQKGRVLVEVNFRAFGNPRQNPVPEWGIIRNFARSQPNFRSTTCRIPRGYEA